MKVVAIIQARMGSTRLPNKVMKKVLGKPLLGWMLDRVRSCSQIDEIVVATTNQARDDLIDDYAKSIGCAIYRGSENDVLDRYYKAAKIYDAEVVVRITADCPLLDPKILEYLLGQFKLNGVDFLSNSEPLPSSWPDGMDVSIIKMDALEKAWKLASKPSDREHVTFYFWNNLHEFTCKRVESAEDLSKYRLTVDYPEDFTLVQKVIEHFNNRGCGIVKASMYEIICYIDANPKIFDLNKKYKRGLGWIDSFERDRQFCR